MLINKKLLIVWIIGFFCLGITFLNLDFIQIPVLKLSDIIPSFYYYLSYTHKEQSLFDKIILISIDDYSLRNIHSKWPWKRSVYAQLLNILNLCQANTVAFDIVFSGKSNIASEDVQFSNSLKRFKGKVILSYFIDKKGKPVLPQEEFIKNSQAIGFLNTPADKDNKIRFSRAYLEFGDFFDYSFAIKVAKLYPFIKEIKRYERKIQIDKTQIPLTLKATFPIKYKVKLKDIKVIPFYDVLKGEFKKDIFKNALVFVGPTSEIIHDFHFTPIGRLPGVLIHINTVLNILNQEILKTLPFLVNLIIAFILVIISGQIIYHFSFLRNVILCTGVLLLLFWLSVFLYSKNYLLPFGNLAFLMISYLGLGNVYKYVSFLKLLVKIKNKSVIDPLTGFYVLRYFYYRTDIETSFSHLQRCYIILIYISSLNSFLKEKEYNFVKDFWREMKSILYTQSKIWSLYGEEILVGLIKTSSKNINFLIDRLKFEIEKFLQEQNVKSQLKIGLCLLSKKIPIKDLITFVSMKLKETEEKVVKIDPHSIPSALKKEVEFRDMLEFLDKDIEEKNRELMKLVEELKNEQRKVKEAYFELITSLIKSLEAKDPYTQGHTQRVCEYAVMLAEKLQLPPEEIEKIKKAALLHDLGKIGIPDTILHKKGKLTPEEFNIIKQHEIIGAKILEHVKEFKDIIPYILYHHERFDGTGYPYGLAGDMIPLGAQIISIADAFDAMVTGRDYKKAYTIKEAVKELEKSKGTQFNPMLVDLFIEALKEKHFL